MVSFQLFYKISEDDIFYILLLGIPFLVLIIYTIVFCKSIL